MRELIGRAVHSPWFVVFVFALGFALAGAMADSFTPRVAITSITVDVATTQPNGDSWDKKAGAPDPNITLSQDGDKLAQCPTTEDAFHATCAPGAVARPGKPLTVYVTDVDTVVDDRIASVSLDLPRDGGTITREHVEGLAKLTLTTVALPGFLSTHRAQLLGAAAGIALGLVIWLLGLRTAASEHRVTAGAVAVGFAFAGVAFAGVMVALPEFPVPAALPCALGATAATLGTLDGVTFKPLRMPAAVGICLGAAAVLLPIVLSAAAIVIGVGVVWLLLLALVDGI